MTLLPAQHSGVSRPLADVLERAADLIEPEGAWTQGAYARDAKGKDINPLEEWKPVKGAVCWCLYGALVQVGAPSPWVNGPKAGIDIPSTDWNDAPERTQAEVVAKLREAAALARKEVAAAIQRNPLAVTALTNGESEVTLAWQDPETEVWLRARADFMPHTVKVGGNVIVVSDLKFVAPTNAHPEGFKRAIANFGYHQSAAFYADGMKAVFGHYPTNWLHVVVEKDEPYCVALYELPGEDIERGRWLNREAIRMFARCLEQDRWPGFADEPIQVGLPLWARKQTDDAEGHELAWAQAA